MSNFLSLLERAGGAGTRAELDNEFVDLAKGAVFVFVLDMVTVLRSSRDESQKNSEPKVISPISRFHRGKLAERDG